MGTISNWPREGGRHPRSRAMQRADFAVRNAEAPLLVAFAEDRTQSCGTRSHVAAHFLQVFGPLLGQLVFEFERVALEERTMGDLKVAASPFIHLHQCR